MLDAPKGTAERRIRVVVLGRQARLQDKPSWIVWRCGDGEPSHGETLRRCRNSAHGRELNAVRHMRDFGHRPKPNRQGHSYALAQPTTLGFDFLGTNVFAMVNATWSRNLGLITILAFKDHSYTIMLGSRRKLALIELGCARWRPNYGHFPRLQRL